MSAIVRNSFYSTISFGLRFVSNAFLFIVIARFLGAEEFGKFALASSLAGIFLIVLDYGFNLYTVKEVAAAPTRAVEFATEVISAKVILTIVSTGVLLLVAKLMGYQHDILIIITVLWIGYIFYSFGLFFNNIFRGFNLFQYEMYPTILLNLLQIIFVALLLILKADTVAIAFAFLAARLLYFAYSLHLFRAKIGKPKLMINLDQSKGLLLKAMPFGIHAIIGVLYFQLDTVLLSYFKGNSDIGYYQSAMRIVTASMVIYDVLASSYLPLISAKIRTDYERFTAYSIALNKYMILVGGIISLSVLVYAETAVTLLYGNGYLQAIVILQLLSVVIFLRFLGGAYGVLITVSDNQRLRAIGVASSLFVNLLLNLFLIPRYGIAGAAVACIVTHVFLNFMYIVFTYKALDSYFFDRKIIPMLTLLLMGSFVAYQMKSVSFTGSLLLFVSFVVLAVASSLDNKEKSSIRGLISRIIPTVIWGGGHK